MNRSILLCDDDIHILRAAEFKLKRAGLEVVCATDGQEAWEKIQQQQIDILVTDCQMPRLDGVGLIKRLRQDEATAQLPIVLLTAKGLELSHDELLGQWQVATIVSKPFSPRQLLACVEQILTTGSYQPAALGV